MDEHDEGKWRTDMDSHANMVIIGKYATISADTRNMVDVHPFTTYYQAL